MDLVFESRNLDGNQMEQITGIVRAFLLKRSKESVLALGYKTSYNTQPC
jgi:hypothetical protein